MIDYANLFEPAPVAFAFANLDDELAAIAAGTKALSMFEISLEELVSSGAEDTPMQLVALAASLTLLTVASTRQEVVRGKVFNRTRLFVLKPNETWRIPAVEAVLAAADIAGWSETTDRIFSTLLGYSEAQIEEWIAIQRRLRPRHGCVSLYAVLGSVARAEAQKLGMRCFPPSAARDIELVRCPPNMVARADAGAAISDGSVLVRAGVTAQSLRDAFGDGTVQSLTPTENLVVQINADVTSKLEIFRDGGWR